MWSPVLAVKWVLYPHSRTLVSYGVLFRPISRISITLSRSRRIVLYFFHPWEIARLSHINCRFVQRNLCNSATSGKWHREWHESLAMGEHVLVISRRKFMAVYIVEVHVLHRAVLGRIMLLHSIFVSFGTLDSDVDTHPTEPTRMKTFIVHHNHAWPAFFLIIFFSTALCMNSHLILADDVVGWAILGCRSMGKWKRWTQGGWFWSD